MNYGRKDAARFASAALNGFGTLRREGFIPEGMHTRQKDKAARKAKPAMTVIGSDEAGNELAIAIYGLTLTDGEPKYEDAVLMVNGETVAGWAYDGCSHHKGARP